MHIGQDTLYYLKKGFRVVAVEANPNLVEQGKREFKGYIDSGRLMIENKCIGTTEGEVDFYVNDQVTEWSSIHKNLGNRGIDGRARKIRVMMTTVSKLFEKHGVPHYIKIDIEGADDQAVKGLWAARPKPKYVSVECSRIDSVCHLFAMGYQSFKLIEQKSFLDARLPSPPLEGSYVNHAFQAGSSGPFGEETGGQWSNLEELLSDFVKYRKFEQKDRRTGQSWIDVHAKFGPFKGS